MIKLKNILIIDKRNNNLNLPTFDNLNANQISINRGNGKMTNSLNPVIYDCAVLNKRF